MRINIWISFNKKSLAHSQIPFDFPYDAKSFLNNKNITYYSVEDIYNELISLFDKEYGKEGLGELLWIQSQSICNLENLVDEDCQQRIVEYRFATEFRTPPYPSLQDVPAQLISDFFIIKDEMAYIKKQKERTDGSK